MGSFRCKDARVVASEENAGVGVGGDVREIGVVSGVEDGVQISLHKSALAELVVHGSTASGVLGLNATSLKLVCAVSQRALAHLGQVGAALESFGLVIVVRVSSDLSGGEEGKRNGTERLDVDHC